MSNQKFSENINNMVSHKDQKSSPQKSMKRSLINHPHTVFNEILKSSNQKLKKKPHDSTTGKFNLSHHQQNNSSPRKKYGDIPKSNINNVSSSNYLFSMLDLEKKASSPINPRSDEQVNIELKKDSNLNEESINKKKKFGKLLKKIKSSKNLDKDIKIKSEVVEGNTRKNLKRESPSKSILNLNSMQKSKKESESYSINSKVKHNKTKIFCCF